jgi:hypothetical protein
MVCICMLRSYLRSCVPAFLTDNDANLILYLWIMANIKAR